MTTSSAVPVELTAVVADDEALARRRILDLLRGREEVRVVGECSTGTATLNTVRVARPDVLFLDVQMPGLDGFDVLARLDPEERPIVVFSTAYDEHALAAFEVNAVDYLLKPYADDRFEESLDRVVEAFVVVEAESVDRIDAEGDYVCLHAGGDTYLLRGTMKSLERRLDPAAFVRVHRSTIVRLERVRQLCSDSHGDYEVVLDGGARIPVGRRYRDAVLERVGMRW